jgi:Flp pilus assembly protein TadG
VGRDSRADRGVVAVEFALLLPLFLLIVMASIDFGYALFVKQVVTNAAREGARSGALIYPPADTGTPTDDAEADALAATQNYLLNGGLDYSAATITTLAGRAVCGLPTARGVCVTIAYPTGSLTGLLSAMMPPTVSARAVMRW